MKQKTQTFNDGVVSIYSVDNIGESGNMAKEGLKIPPKVEALRFEERIVGMGRFWSAKQYQIKIDRMIRVPRIQSVSSQDVAVLVDGQYEIKQVQYPPDVLPLSMDLSLERLVEEYEIS
jgi:hypothetical protein